MRRLAALLPLLSLACGLESTGLSEPGQDASVIPDATVLPDAPIADVQSSPDVVSGPDAGAPDTSSVPDSGPTIDAGVDSGAPDPGLHCGSVLCNPKMDLCCVHGDTSTTCQKNTGGCVGTLYCDSTADCPLNMVCCGTIVPLNAVCKSSCSVAETRLCDPVLKDCPTCTLVSGSYGRC